MIPVLHRAQEKQALPGIGVEIDVWLCAGTYDVSPAPFAGMGHDGPDSEATSLSDWLRDDVQHAGFRPLYAVNCKSDGLHEPVCDAFDRLGIPRDRWFAFDCSYPAQRAFQQARLPFAERVSEEEPYRGHSCLVWLDRWSWRDNGARFSEVIDGGTNVVRTLRGKILEIHAVSIELHVPDAVHHERVQWWRWLMEEVRPASICTDYPQELADVLRHP